jgi:hypothetical protein
MVHTGVLAITSTAWRPLIQCGARKGKAEHPTCQRKQQDTTCDAAPRRETKRWAVNALESASFVAPTKAVPGAVPDWRYNFVHALLVKRVISKREARTTLCTSGR